MLAPGRPIAQVPFIDGVVRAVYEDEESEGRQFVLDDDGQRVYGVWVLPPENHRRCSKMLVDVVHEIGARMGRAKANYILGCGS